MAKASGDLHTILKRLTSALLGLEPVAVYLFGSQATGEARPDSDIDLAILLPKGKELSSLERLDMMDHLQEIAGREVDLVAVNAARLPLQFEIIHTGRVLYESSFDARTDAEDIIVRDYPDLQPMYERNSWEILEAAQEEARAQHVQRTACGRSRAAYSDFPRPLGEAGCFILGRVRGKSGQLCHC